MQNAYLLLLRSREVCTVSYGFMAQVRSVRGKKSEQKKKGSVTYSTDQENKVSKISLSSKRWLKQTFEFSGPYTLSRVQPAKLTNYSACTN